MPSSIVLHLIDAIAFIATALKDIVVGWAGIAMRSVITAIPLYFLWIWLAPLYFTFVPAAWQAIPFLHIAAVVALISLINRAVRA